MRSTINNIFQVVYKGKLDILGCALDCYTNLGSEEAQKHISEYARRVYKDASIQIKEHIQRTGDGAHDFQNITSATPRSRETESLADKDKENSIGRTPDNLKLPFDNKVKALQDLHLQKFKIWLKRR